MKTCYAYLNMVSHFLREVKVPLKEIQVQDVNQYIASLKKGDKPQTYLRTLWYCLNRYFGYLVRTGEVGENIMERVIKPKAKPNREIKRTCLTPEEYKLLLSAARRDPDDWQSARNTAIIRILIETGIRVSALTEINVEDILPKQHAIRITDKENKNHRLPYQHRGDERPSCLVWPAPAHQRQAPGRTRPFPLHERSPSPGGGG